MVQLNFDSPQWPAKRREITEKLKQLSCLIDEEVGLIFLRDAYLTGDCVDSDAIICTHAHVSGGELQMIYRLELPVVLLQSVIRDYCNSEIEQRREAISRLLSEFAG